MLRLGLTHQHAGDGLRGSDEQNVAFCRRREGTVLSASLIIVRRQQPCSTLPKPFKMNFSLSNTAAFAVHPNTLPWSNVPRQAAMRHTMIRTARRDLRTTSASSFEHRRSSLSISPLCLFTRGFRTLPSTKPPKLMAF